MARPPVLIASLAGLALAGPAWAERPITFAEALGAAARANPDVTGASYDVDAAEAGLVSSKGILDPVLDANIGWNRRQQRGFFQGFPYKSVSQFFDMGLDLSGELPIGTQYTVSASLDRNYSEYVTELGAGPTESIEDAWFSNTSVSIRQPLLRGIHTAFTMRNVTIARDGLTVAELTQERTRQEVLADAARAYWTLAYERELEQIAESQVEAATEALRVGRLRRESGEIAPVEQTRLEAALVQAQQDQLTVTIAAAQAADALLLLMGEDPGEDLLPSTPIGEVPPLTLDVDAAVGVGLAQNLDLSVARAQLESTRTAHVVSKHAKLPTLAAIASAGIGAQGATAGESVSGIFGEESFPFVAVGGEFSVPLGNRALKGDEQRTGADLYKAELDLQELERTITSQIQHQVLVLQQAGRTVELADVNLRLAEETLAAEEALEKAGRAIQKDVLEARTEAFRARVEATKARADYRLAQTELLRLQGQIDLAVP